MKLAWSLPAGLLGMPLLALVVLIPLNSRVRKIQHYQTALLDASQAGDEVKELLVLKKLDQLGYQRQDRVDYQRAIAMADDGLVREAYEIMQKIAPMEEPRYFYAHVWIAASLLEGTIQEADLWDVIDRHTEHAATLNPYETVVERLQVEVHLHHGRLAAANRLMEANVVSYPSYHATLMHNFRLVNERSEARKHAKRAILFFDRSDPATITTLGHLRYAEAHEILGNDLLELRALAAAAERFPDNEEVRSTRSKTISRKVRSVAWDDPVGAELVFELFRTDPDHPDLLNALLAGYSGDAPGAVDLVNRLGTADLLPAAFYKLMGDLNFTREAYAIALKNYEKACRLDPQAATAWNNVAWILGNLPPVDLPRAIDAVNTAIDCRPDPRFYETRGQIWIRLERWDLAIADLEHAVNGEIPDAAAVHRSLAKAYDRVGDLELALAHRSIADQEVDP